MLRIAPMSALLILTACPSPPEVPEVEDQPDLDELCHDLFAHHPDQDHAQLVEDLAWLELWLDEFEADTREGYQVSALSEAAVDALDDVDRETEDMFGVVVGSISAHSVTDAAHAMVTVDQEEIHADNYSDYQVEYLSDLDCFVDRSCDRLELTEDYTAHLLLGVQADNHTQNQYLWLDTPNGLAMLHRAWLPEPPEVSMDWLAIQEQVYLDVFLPWDGGHYRIQTTWLVHEQDSVPEDAVMNMVITGMQDHSENLEAWLDVN